MIESLSGAKFFSILDLARGYFQVPIVEKDKKKTAFRTLSGLYEFNRMPFALKGAPATFCQMMSLVLGHLTPIQLLLYMDDLCIVSDTFQLHLDRLGQAFITLHKHGLRLNATKCQFVTTQAIFCGFRISAEGINPDLEKVAAIERIPTPTTVKEVKIFLGITGFYRRFIPRYATIAAPLTSMLAGEQTFQWSTHCQDAFNTLKRKLSTALILAHPVADKPFVLTTDTSTVGIGAELAQESSEELQPIEYFI